MLPNVEGDWWAILADSDSASVLRGKRAEQDWQRKRTRLDIGGSGDPES